MDVLVRHFAATSGVLDFHAVPGRCKVMNLVTCARILGRRTGGLPRTFFELSASRKREFHWALVADDEHVSMLM